MSPVQVIPRCPAAIVDASLAQLEKSMSEDPDARPYCYPEALGKRGAQAVPMLLRLLNHERHPVRLGAAHGIAHLREQGVAALPALIARHRSLVAEVARQEAARGVAGVDQETRELMHSLSGAIGGLQAVDASVVPYLEGLFFDPASTLDVRRASAMHVWARDTPVGTRLRMLPVLLADETTFAGMRTPVRDFLMYSGVDATFILPQLRASLLLPRGYEMAEPYLAVEGVLRGMAHLLQLYADAPKGSDMRHEIESLFRRRDTLPEVDWQFSAAARNPALLPAVVALMQSGVESRRTIDYLSTRLDVPSGIDATVRNLTALHRPAPQAHARLVALLLASAKDDRARRDGLLNALIATQGQAAVPQKFLLAGLQDDIALNRRRTDRPGPYGSCLPGKVLAQAAPLAQTYLPVLKRAFAEADRPYPSECARVVVDVIANIGTLPALEFLYAQLLSNGSPEYRKLLVQTLTEHVGPLLPRIGRDIDGLRGDRRADVEALLVGPQAQQFLADYRARVVPGLLTLPWTKAGALDWSLLDEEKSPNNIPACNELSQTVKRVGSLGLSTPEVTTWLMRVYAGPCMYARMDAKKVLSALRQDEYTKRPARVRQVKALLATTPPGRARERLEQLQRLFDWSGYEQRMNEMTPERVFDEN